MNLSLTNCSFSLDSPHNLLTDGIVTGHALNYIIYSHILLCIISLIHVYTYSCTYILLACIIYLTSLSTSPSTHTHTHTHTHTGLALVEITENPGTLFESQSIILSCTIDGGSDGNFTWFRNGVELTSSEVNVTVTGNHLMVSYLTVAEWNGACIRCRAVAMTAYGSSTLNLTVACKFSLLSISVIN